MIINRPTAADIPALRALWREAFSDSDESLDGFFGTAFSHKRSLVLRDGGEVLAALYWFDCSLRGEKIAYIYAVATAGEHRGRGLCRALMNSTHEQLLTLGYRGAVLVPGDESLFALYEKMGYKVCSELCEFTVKADTLGMDLRHIDGAEYESLRRELLPEGGVVQEGENTAFLQTFVDFYAGNGVVLAAGKSGDVLHCVELLGDNEKASAVLSALGCREGKFRTPGRGRAFAMYLPLDGGENVPPSYFGLAFD